MPAVLRVNTTEVFRLFNGWLDLTAEQAVGKG